MKGDKEILFLEHTLWFVLHFNGLSSQEGEGAYSHGALCTSLGNLWKDWGNSHYLFLLR